jgi:hypothetical protein
MSKANVNVTIQGVQTGRFVPTENPVTEVARPPKRHKSAHHNLKPTHTPGNGKQVTWVCRNNKCHYVDSGGVAIVYGCPKPAPPPKKW